MDVQITCICPPKDGQPRHEQDTVTLPDVLDFRTTLKIRSILRSEQEWVKANGEVFTISDTIAVLGEAYLLNTIAAWSLEDEQGKPVPVSKAAIRDRLMVHYEEAETVGNACDALYSDKVVLPLLTGASSSSSRTPTKPPTSQTTNGSTPRRQRTPSKRSSTSTSPMAVTGPMAASPGGASSSSLT